MPIFCENCFKKGHNALFCLKNKTYCKKGCCVLYRQKPNIKYYENQIRDRVFRSGICLKNSDDKVLLVQSNGFKWGFPKGGVEKNETPKTAALRELKEEIGIETEVENKFLKKGKYYYFFGKVKETPIINFSEEINGYGWINMDCLLESIREGLINPNSYLLKFLQTSIKYTKCPKIKEYLKKYSNILGFWQDEKNLFITHRKNGKYTIDQYVL